MTVRVPRAGAPTRRASQDDQDVQNVEAAVRGVDLTPVYQPIVTLPDGAVVGYEALARWPTFDLSPLVVFDNARATGQVDELDRLCVDRAIKGALGGDLASGALLCINCEPTSAAVFTMQNALLQRGQADFQVMFELTERSLLTHPHVLLRKVAALRGLGFAIALDDVGAHPDSMALLDVVSPDVVKLDLGLVQSQPDDDQARTLSAVLAHHERTGAVILAEGIETDDHLEQAMAVGATLGQGYKFGRPAPLDEHPRPTSWSPPVRTSRPDVASGSPFDLVLDRTAMRTGRKQTLTAFSRHIESQARNATDPPILLTALQRAEHFTGRTRQDYRDFATRSPLVAVFGRDLPKDLGPGTRGVALNPGDALIAEWTVLALGPHTAAALIAREHDDNRDYDRDDRNRRFDFVITYDRELVTAAACNLLDRVP